MSARGALLVVGATSGAGKSTVVSALCRAWAREGARVAPYKAQNMSNHSAVTADGGEIGRAQAMQALAARVEPDRRMNPVLLKPAGDRTSHLVVLGEEDPGRRADAKGYGDTARSLRPLVLDALTSLRRVHDLVVAEGAGGAAEINLLDRDLVNLPLAAAAGMPAVLVVDIDRGGAFASAYGTLALLPEHLRACVRGVVFNRFRGDVSLLDDGLRDLEARTGVPVLGVLPHLGAEPMLGVEDSLDLEWGLQWGGDAPGPAAAWKRPVRVAVVRLPHLANPSDLDPLVLEPSVALRWAHNPGDLADADLVIVPGSRATVADLAWVRSRGLDRALADLDPSVLVVGLCAGYQMLGRSIEDTVESGAGRVDGIGLLPSTTRFETPKVVRQSSGPSVTGYQIRFGRPVAPDGTAWLTLDGEAEGCVSADERVRGTSLHGLLDADGFRCSLLAEAAERRGRSYAPMPVGFAAAREAHLDRLADWVSAALPLDRLAALAASAAAPGEEPGW